MTEFEQDLNRNQASMSRLLRYFAGAATALLVGVGGWAATAKVESAVIAGGTFVVQSSAQAVQHLEGGVVGAILVKEGQDVRAGQVVARLDAARVNAELSIVERKLMELTIERARLVADRAGHAIIQPPEPPFPLGANATAFQTTLQLQQTLLTSQQAARASQHAQLQERRSQIESEMAGLDRVMRARREESTQILADLEVFKELDAKRLLRRSVLRDTERQVARVRGDMGDIEAKLAGARSRLSETNFKIAEIERNKRSEILEGLRNVEARIAEATEQRSAALDRMQRLEIRAPKAGLVHELAVHTVGGIVGAGHKLMSIIPVDDDLIVSAKIQTHDIDRVRIGQKASVRISAFSRSQSPELDGIVTNVSADQTQDEATGKTFFAVKIAIKAGERIKIADKKLTPGLPAEVYLRGEARRVIEYLTQPLADQMAQALRER